MCSSNTTIAIYMPSLGGGGAERVMVTLSNGFVERGFKVDLVLATACGPYFSEVSSSVNLVSLGCSRVITSLPGLVQYLRRHKPAALLSAIGYANAVAVLAIILSGVNTRVVVSERNDPSEEAVQSRGLRSLVIQTLNRFLYRRADAIHAVSHGVAASTATQFSLPKESVHVVYNPVFTQQILDMSRETVHLPWPVHNNTPLILAAGRLTMQKNFATLIRAFALVRRKINARLVIMGEGELRSKLDLLITQLELQQSVHLPGFVTNPFVAMKAADLFVLSSAWEGLPNVLIQAMACGSPVVSTDCPSGPAEILENGKWGRLVPVGNVDALAQAILDSLENTEHPDVVSRASFFSVEQAVDGYLRLLLPDAN
jgi:glycosyltransferase involved in cell wall biosynthesis